MEFMISYGVVLLVIILWHLQGISRNLQKLVDELTDDD